MGDELRTSEVTNGADSITEYANARDLLALGRLDEAQALLDDIGEYNRYDCVSTLRLRDWLLARAAENGVPIGRPPAEESRGRRPTSRRSGPGSWRSPAIRSTRTARADRQAMALAAAAIDFHRREQKSFWQRHFARLIQPVEEWADTRDVLVVEKAAVRARLVPRGGPARRAAELLLTGQWGAGSAVRVSDERAVPAVRVPRAVPRSRARSPEPAPRATVTP